MATHRITAPVPGHTGLVGNVMFKDGVAEVDEAVNPAELAYCRQAGYGVEEIAPAEPVQVDVDDDGVLDMLPKKSASTEEWRAFAVAHGMPEDEANSKSRDELVAHYYEGSAQ